MTGAATLAPTCPRCLRVARLTDGGEIYPHRLDLFNKAMWKCDGCGGYVGCHPGSTKPLGTPADQATRNARELLHDRMIDPLWRNAHRCGAYNPEDRAAVEKIQRTARSRVYGFLADRLDLDFKNCHIGMFDLETCRRAWRVLQGRTYNDIREWYKTTRAPARAKKPDGERDGIRGRHQGAGRADAHRD